MFKKILVGSVVLVFGMLLLYSYSFLKTERNKQKQPIEAIPTDATIIIESMHLRDTWMRISETNLVYAQTLGIAAVTDFDKKIRFVDPLLQLDSNLVPLVKNNATALSFHCSVSKNNAIVWNYLLASQATSSQWNLVQKTFELVGSKKIELKAVNETAYFKFETEHQSFYAAYATPLLLIASEEALLLKSLDQLEKRTSLLNDTTFLEIRKHFSSSVPLRVYFQVAPVESIIKSWLTDEGLSAWENMAFKKPNWLAFDLTTKADALLLSGYGWSKTTTEKVENQSLNSASFHNLLPNPITQLDKQVYNTSSSILDTSAVKLMEILSEQCNCDVAESLNSWFGKEALHLKFKTTNTSETEAWLLSINDEVNIMGQMSQFGIDATKPLKVGASYAFPFKDLKLLKLLGFNDIDTLRCSHFAQIGSFAVFSSLAGLQQIDATYQSNLTTINENNFLNFQAKLLSNFTQKTYFYQSETFFKHYLRYFKSPYHSVAEQTANTLSAIQSIGFQSNTINKNLSYFTFVITSNQGKNNGITTPAEIEAPTNQDAFLWNITLKNNVIKAPELIKNHQTNTFEIVIQDVENTLYLISPTGKVKWTKPLTEPIIGPIQQIDLYNNGKLQLVFNTESKIYCIDINGNSVPGYPIKLLSKATNSVAVMDYENKKDYRYLIATIDKKIYNYDKEGALVKGWSFKGSQSIIINPIEHFVTAGKDYLYASDIEGAIYLLDRKGMIRQPFSKKYETDQKSSVILQKGYALEYCKIVYVNSKGQLNELALNGTYTTLFSDTAKQIQFFPIDVDNDKKQEWVIGSGTKLTVCNADKKIIFADVFPFEISGNITVTGMQKKYILIENKADETVIIYNHKFEKNTSFKSKATKLATIGDLNADGKDDLITIVNGKQLIVYTVSTLYGI